MNKKVSIVIKYLYLLIIAVFIAYATIGIYSYLSVYLTFGSVPPTEDYTAKFIGDSGKEFKIVSPDIGLAAFFGYYIAILFAIIFIPIILIWKYVDRELNIHVPILIILCALFLGIMIVQNYTDAVWWYYGYILD
jgi:hypothetical protein